MNNVLTVENINISYKTGKGLKETVKSVSFALRSKELLALVGGSGCGKTTLCKALVGLLDNKAAVSGSIEMVNDSRVAMVFQDPYLSLDPSQPIGKQIEETVLIHHDNHRNQNIKSKKEFAREKSLELLTMVGIDNPKQRYMHIPINFSGGMRQRIAIAIALAMEPNIIIADELTSALDSENKEQILTLLNSLRDRLGTAIILVTHDLGLAENHSDRVIVMKDGRIVEDGDTVSIFNNPKNRYTKDLLRYASYGKGTEHTHGDLHFHNGKPHSHEHEAHGKRTGHSHNQITSSINRDERLGHIPHIIEIKNLSKSYNDLHVFENVNINIHHKELLGLWGESGIGKTTLAKCISGLEKPDSGNIKYASGLNEKNKIQMIFQDSKSALNPRMTVRDQINEALKLSSSDSKSVRGLMEMVELDLSLLSKRPHEISGGQRQRVAIARALSMNPELLIADEPVSSLDMAVQAQMIHLIKRVQEENNLTVLLISHDIPMLMHVCDRIISLS